MLIDLTNVNLVAVLVAAVLPFAIGFLWYGKPLFGDQWQKEIGLSDKQLKNANMTQTMGISLVCNLITATVLASILSALVLDPTPIEGLATAAFLAFGLVGTSFLVNYLFGQRSYLLWFIDAGYMLVNISLMGLVIGLLQ